MGKHHFDDFGYGPAIDLPLNWDKTVVLHFLPNADFNTRGLCYLAGTDDHRYFRIDFIYHTVRFALVKDDYGYKSKAFGKLKWGPPVMLKRWSTDFEPTGNWLVFTPSLG